MNFVTPDNLKTIITKLCARFVTYSSLAGVATSGSYNDLKDKPTIASFPDLAKVATSGSYTDLSDKPTIPTSLKNPNALTFTGGATGTYDGSSAKTVSIPVVDSKLSASTNAIQNSAVNDAVSTINTTLKAKLNTADLTPNLLYDTLHAKGANFVPTDVTNAGWNSLGLFISYYKDYVLKNQPNQYGQLINICADASTNNSTQLWIDQPTGKLAYRGGNVNSPINDKAFAYVATATELTNAKSELKTSISGLTTNVSELSTNISELSTRVDGKVDTSSLSAIATSGKYNDLTGTPSTFTGASAEKGGTTGLVPAPSAGEQSKFLSAGGTWEIVSVNDKAPIESPTFTGTVTIPTLAVTGNATVGGNITATGTITASKVYNAVYNDYAEWFERGDDAQTGHIIALDENEERYIKATKGSKVVVGICTDNYAQIIGGEPHEDYIAHNLKKFIPVSLAGRVPVYVKGKVKAGDYIVPSDISGIGEIGNKTESVGIALESNENEDIKLVKVLVRR